MLALERLWQFFGIGGVVALLIGAAVATTYSNWITVPAAQRVARAAGAEEERAIWTKLQEDARRKAEDERRAAQAKIDAVERELHAKDRARQDALDALEEAARQDEHEQAAAEARQAELARQVIEARRGLQEYEDNATPIPTPSPGAPCVCRPALSRGVLERLDAVGRRAPASGGHPAQSQAPVR